MQRECYMGDVRGARGRLTPTGFLGGVGLACLVALASIQTCPGRAVCPRPCCADAAPEPEPAVAHEMCCGRLAAPDRAPAMPATGPEVQSPPIVQLAIVPPCPAPLAEYRPVRRAPDRIYRPPSDPIFLRNRSLLV
jgi:hypothetical protein